MKKIYLLFLTICGAMSIGVCQTKAEDVQSFTLDNGMKIIVLEDHSIPNANMYLFWKVGSRNEYPGITGLSHFFEHMMFNGAEKYGPKQFDQVMEANGGSNNAYTTENITVYTDWFPSSSLEVIFDLEADRIGHLKLDSNMVESERGVVLSERSTGLENSNYRLINEQLKSVAFMAHPYRWSVIGYESDIENWKLDDLQNYFNTYYAPNNAVVVISGDVSLENVKSLAKQYFEPIPSQDPPRPVHTVEPEQMGEKRVHVTKQVSTPNIMLAFHTPEASHEDYYALALLENILSSGRSSRLNNQLVNELQVATTAFASYSTSFDPNLFYIYSVCSRNSNAAQLEAAILSILSDIRENGITEKELQKAKNQKLVAFYRNIETINGKSNNLGTYELFFGDYKRLFDAPAEFEKVTAEDIQNVAQKYFEKQSRSVAVLQSSFEEDDQEDAAGL